MRVWNGAVGRLGRREAATVRGEHPFSNDPRNFTRNVPDCGLSYDEVDMVMKFCGMRMDENQQIITDDWVQDDNDEDPFY